MVQSDIWCRAICGAERYVVQSDIVGIKREEVTGGWRKYILKSFKIFGAHQTFR
jgi:hypothetical protein